MEDKNSYDNDNPIFEVVIYFIILMLIFLFIFIEATGVYEK